MSILRSRLKLLTLILVFFGPLFLAMLIYFNPHWLSLPTSKSYGELVMPPQPLTDFTAVSRTGQALPHDLLNNKWTLLYWGNATCNLDCEASLFKMRQVRLSLSKNIERTQTLYLASEPTADTLEPLLKRHPQLITAHLKPGKTNPFRKQISIHPKGGIYIIDPFGNLMMRYTEDASSKGILKDLKKLLRISRIG